jgi:hypothetical protein
MATYNLKYNSDDSVIRHIIVGLLADLNNKIYIKRQISETERISVDVPFYYSISGDDEFLRDNFLFKHPGGVGCDPSADFADGNYDAVPRGVANLTSFSIDSAKLVNRGIRGEYSKLDATGKLQNYTSEFVMVPITLSFDIEILVSSMLDALKMSESLIKTLYKSNSYSVEVGHLNDGIFRLPAQYSMPEDYDVVRAIDFTFEDKEQYKANFSIEVLSHIPSFDDLSELHSNTRMHNHAGNQTIVGSIGTGVDDGTGTSISGALESVSETSQLFGNGMQHGLIVVPTNAIEDDEI